LSLKRGIPGTWCLFESIEGFGELAMIGWILGINKPRGLLHIDLLLNNTIKEHVLNIQLTKSPIMRVSKR
jgi:hypothetical protein